MVHYDVALVTIYSSWHVYCYKNRGENRRIRTKHKNHWYSLSLS